MIKAINLSKSFALQDLFDDVNFSLNHGERVGLVGRNGHGKTTLLRLITGDEQPDSGVLSIPKDYRIGYLSQHINFTLPTILEEGALGLPEHQKGDTWLVEKILTGLGFSKEQMQRSPSELSGGYQLRLNLVKVLVSDPDLLLLDEPTNYLDIVSIRWLSSFLRQWRNELILITHDRSFMDGVVTHILGIHRKKIKKISGTTNKFYEQIIKEEEIHEKTRLNDEKKRKEVEVFISRFRAKARLAGMVQSRIKALEKADTLDKLEKIKSLDFSFNYKPTQGKSLLHVKDLTFGYNASNPLIKDLSFNVGKNDRICVIGKNGRGKTTLLKLLSGELTPQNGEILGHPSTETNYYAQTNSIDLNEALTVEEEIMNIGCERQQARNICGAMMFEGDDALKSIKVLSGGEKARVLLGKIIATPSNLLFLDEPTNHLDMDSCDSFLSAIDAFDGAVIIVTHNEMFLHALANRFIIFQNDGVLVYEGSYQRFLDNIGWEDENAEASVKTNSNESLTVNKKELRKKRADILNKRREELLPIEGSISVTEKAIEEMEKKLALFNNEIIEASANGESAKINELSMSIHSLKKNIDENYDKLSELTELADEKNAEYDAALAVFEKTE